MQQNACPTHKPFWQVQSFQNNHIAQGQKNPCHWEEVHLKALNDVKANITKDVTLAYPDYSEGFEIYTDVSKDNFESSLLKRTGHLLSSAENSLLVSKNTA